MVIEIYQNERHKKIVESRGDRYTYIGSYHRNEITLDGKNKINERALGELEKEINNKKVLTFNLKVI